MITSFCSSFQICQVINFLLQVDINDLKELTQQRSDMYISVDRSYVLGCFLRKEDERNEALIVRILDRLREIDGLCCVTDIMKPFL